MFAQCTQHLPVAPASPAGGRRGSTQQKRYTICCFFRPSRESNLRRRTTLIQKYPLRQTRAIGNSIHLSYYIYYIFLHSTRRHVSLYADFTPHIGLTVSSYLTAPDTPPRVPVYHTMHSKQYAALMTEVRIEPSTSSYFLYKSIHSAKRGLLEIRSTYHIYILYIST